jgi:hypothetical protein
VTISSTTQKRFYARRKSPASIPALSTATTWTLPPGVQFKMACQTRICYSMKVLGCQLSGYPTQCS